MTWEEVKRILPNQWVIIEAIEAHTEENKRVWDNVAVVDTFQEDNSKNALLYYAKLHRKHGDREMFVFHTSRPELNIIEERRIGVRLRT